MVPACSSARGCWVCRPVLRVWLPLCRAAAGSPHVPSSLTTSLLGTQRNGLAAVTGNPMRNKSSSPEETHYLTLQK